MMNTYMQKINDYLKTDIEQQETQFYSTFIDPQINTSHIFETQLRKSTQYLQVLKKNSHKVEQLIMQNDKLKNEVSMQRRSIEMHLKKEIQLKYVVSSLEEEIQLMNAKLIGQEVLLSKARPQFEESIRIDQKEFCKLQQKLYNCIAQNDILRQENKNYHEIEFTKQKNYRTIQQKFKESLRSMSEEINLLKSDLQYQTQKALLLQKIEAENTMLKNQNRRMQSTMDIKFEEYDQRLSHLMSELQNQRYGKQMLKEKYQQLSDIIGIVDEMRFEFKSKKKSLEYIKEENDLLNDVEFNQLYPLVSLDKNTSKVAKKKIRGNNCDLVKTKSLKENLRNA